MTQKVKIVRQSASIQSRINSGMPEYHRKPHSVAESEFRQERERVQGIHVGEMIRTRLLKKVNNQLLRPLTGDPEDKVPLSESRVFDPYAQVQYVDNDGNPDNK